MRLEYHRVRPQLPPQMPRKINRADHDRARPCFERRRAQPLAPDFRIVLDGIELAIDDAL